ncbi:TPA: restriction endonuclease subunit S [Streptococcus suis]|nr:restriction endonuclease subunit S [Streptococcus suis]
MSEVKLGDIGKISMCKRILKSQTNEVSGIPFYKISTFGGIADVFIDEAIFHEYKEKYSYPKKGDILISAAGTVGKTVIYTGEDAYFQDSNIVWIDNNEKIVTNQYLYYFYQTNPFVSTNGSTIKRLYNDNIRETKIKNVPSIEAQNKVTKVLEYLDQKIALNNQINEELEAMAKTLYDYWFVQFDFPDENGKPYKSSGGKMVYNDQLKREIPEGWGVKQLGELCEFRNGINYEKSEAGDTLSKIVNVRNISNSSTFVTTYDLDSITLDRRRIENYLVTDRTILITRSGIPGATRLVSDIPANTIYSGFIIGATVANLNLFYYVFYHLKNIEMLMSNQSAGTIMKNISQTTLSEIRIAIPNKEIQKVFSNQVRSVLDVIENNLKQNQELTQLRDWLLPMLMNGQVKVE